MAIIKSLLDTDLYKFTMWQTALNQFPTTSVRYEFKCRNKAVFSERMVNRIKEEIEHYCSLQLSSAEIGYLESLGFFREGFLNFLSLYKPNSEHISVRHENGQVEIEAEGPWFLTIPFEVPVLAIVNEVWFSESGYDIAGIRGGGEQRLAAKAALLGKYDSADFTVADFGTRRRFSAEWQEYVINELKGLPVFAGTSNVDIAFRFGLKPIGTMAHEFLMVGQAQDDVPLARFQQKMLQAWVDEYRGDLGIALTDTVGIDAFLRDFDKYFAKLYDGLRHDSGDPLWWAGKVIDHYKKLKIDPSGKTLVFSDGLDPERAVSIYEKLKGQARISFGIGTNLTNDFPGLEPLNIVMKITEANGRPVAKISDSPGKGMCRDQAFLDYLRKVFLL